DGQYTIDDAEREEAGTTVTLHLKATDEEDGIKDYTQEHEIRTIVKRYSDFVAYPLFMNVERTEIDRDEEGKPLPDAEERKVVTAEQLNSMKALWLRDKEDVTEDEYNEFYKHISHDWTDPLVRIQAKMEGTLEYRLLLYLPEKAPFDMMMPADTRKNGLHLYIKRVFIMDDCTELLPDYLRFVKGVVDSEDLPLNVSRELLQENRQVQRMSKGIVSKVLAALKQLSKKEPEKFNTFWKEFGRTLKEGIFQDPENKDAILDLMRASTTKSGEDAVSLDTYIEQMPEGQDAIYYITGESQARLLSSPHIEAFRDRGYEVLLLSDPVDEIWTQYVTEYKEKPLKAIGKGEVDLDVSSETEKEEVAKEREEQSKEYGDLLGAIKTALDENVKEVRLSGRLTESAACLVLDDNDVSPQLEKMLRSMGQEVPATKRILELNPTHPLLEKLKELHEKDSASESLKPYAELLYGQALLAEGGQMADPAALSKHIAGVMLKALENG
ncbi:MAG: molecular chaperone HtpG, partial [Candidatus Hydrogenedentes bacterium]|nr:molecular chaperone HtpG [Candidatus Hydrogenedentota bacterium]